MHCQSTKIINFRALSRRKAVYLNAADHHRSAEMTDIVLVFKLQINIWHRGLTTGLRPGLGFLGLGLRLGLRLELQSLSLQI